MNSYSIFYFLNPTVCIAATLTLLIAAVKIPVSANDSNVRYLAQTPQLPNSPLPDRRQDREIEPLPPIDDFLESPERSPGSESPETAIEFTIQEFKLEGNTVLDPAEIELVIQEYRDRPITFADLLELETELTRLYTENGYINSAVVIPAQNVSQGVITIQAVEGTVAEINVTVDGRLKEGYVRSRLQRGIGKVLNVNQLQEALQLLQLNPLIENLNAELSVGLSRDRWMLDVDVNQGQAFDPVLFANNYRTPAVGSFQRGLELNHNNVLGYADRFSFIYKNTDGSNDFDTSYTIPVNSLDGTVGLRYRYVDSEIIESEFDSLNLESETSEFELTLRQPLLLEANAESTQEFALGLEFSRQSNSTTVDLEGDSQGRIPLDLVANPTGRDGGDIGETNVSALRFFQDWTRRSRTDVIALRSQVSVGLNIFDATVLDDAPDGEFVAWRGQVQWLRQLATSSNINLLLRSDIQLSSDDLVPLERFSLGGVESVRGYRQDALLGDSGIFASAEVRIPFYRWNNNQSNLSVAPFFDVGSNWSNSDESDRDDDTLASLGVGLQLNLDDSLRARIDYGIPLIDIENDDHTLQENGLYLSLDYFPF